MKAPLTRIATITAILLVVIYAFFAFPRGVHAWEAKQRQIREAERRNAELARALERKREHVQRLIHNPAEQELEIRKRLKLLRPDEKSYIVGEPGSSDPNGH